MTAPSVREAYIQYRRKQIAELRPWQAGDDMAGISVSAEDTKAGSPKPGDMIARNPKNHADQWLVAAAYFADNFEPLTATPPAPTPSAARALPANRIWFDTEFIEDGTTIDLISIGMVRSDGATYYAETDQWIPGKASQWVKDNVIVHLKGGDCIKPRDVIAREIVEFAGEKPEFWAYYADYDWVALCQLFGTMMQLPDGWPMFCRDIKQWAVDLGNPKLPEQTSTEHHALADALWNKETWDFLALLPDAAAIRADAEMLDETLATLKHARVFISSREKMHPQGIELFDELTGRIAAAIRAAGEK
jgi:hypothetical protein